MSLKDSITKQKGTRGYTFKNPANPLANWLFRDFSGVETAFFPELSYKLFTFQTHPELPPSARSCVPGRLLTDRQSGHRINPVLPPPGKQFSTAFMPPKKFSTAPRARRVNERNLGLFSAPLFLSLSSSSLSIVSLLLSFPLPFLTAGFAKCNRKRAAKTVAGQNPRTVPPRAAPLRKASPRATQIPCDPLPDDSRAEAGEIR